MGISSLRSLCCAILVALPGVPGLGATLNDYPTAARADYVFACMKANGENIQMLEKCSCSIDIIASLLSYEQYVSAETFLQMGQISGEKGVLFRSSEPAKAAIDNLRRSQAEAEVRCF